MKPPISAEITDQLGVGICVWELERPGDRTSLVLRICNPAAGRFLGVEPAAVLDRAIAVGFPGSLETPLPGVFTRVIESGAAMSLGDVPYADEVVPDGVFAIEVKPIGDRHALVEFTNVTHERRAQARVEEMLQQAESARAEAERLGEQTRSLDQQLRQLEQRKREIETVTAPIIEVWTGVLALPMVGQFDADRSAVVREKLLAAVVDRKARHVIIDVTGLESVDETSAGEILRSWRALALLGTTAYVTGLSASNARTMARLDQQIPADMCLRSLEEALRRIIAQTT